MGKAGAGSAADNKEADQKQKNKKIGSIYHDIGSAGGFAGARTLYNEVKARYPDVTKRDVQHFLEGDRTYTLFKPRRLNFPKSKTIPMGFMTNLQVDLADFQQLADENDDYRYLLVGVDVLSRRCFAVPVHSKESEEMKKGFEELFKQMPNLPSEIFSDNGREFESREMLKYFAKKGISKFSSNRGEQKAAVAERFIRTIKDRLYRYFSEKNTTRYIEAVPKIIEGLNKTVNTATGIAPNEVTAEMTKELWDRLYKDALLPNQSPKNTRYKAGDAVRMSKGKRTFDKSYWPRFTDEIFKVKHVIKGKPNYYTIEDHKKEPILGRLYEEELAKTRLDENTTYRIERILKRERGRSLVKFIGYPEPEWVYTNDLT